MDTGFPLTIGNTKKLLFNKFNILFYSSGNIFDSKMNNIYVENSDGVPW